jgi:hypothetical protein
MVTLPQEDRFILLLDPMDRWIIWDCLLDEPVSENGGVGPTRDHGFMEMIRCSLEWRHGMRSNSGAESSRWSRPAFLRHWRRAQPVVLPEVVLPEVALPEPDSEQ